MGAGLDVLEYEKSSFENLFTSSLPEEFQYLTQVGVMLFYPLMLLVGQKRAKQKLAQTIVDKIKRNFVNLLQMKKTIFVFGSHYYCFTRFCFRLVNILLFLET